MICPLSERQPVEGCVLTERGTRGVEGVPGVRAALTPKRFRAEAKWRNVSYQTLINRVLAKHVGKDVA